MAAVSLLSHYEVNDAHTSQAGTQLLLTLGHKPINIQGFHNVLFRMQAKSQKVHFTLYCTLINLMEIFQRVRLWRYIISKWSNGSFCESERWPAVIPNQVVGRIWFHCFILIYHLSYLINNTRDGVLLFFFNSVCQQN